MQSQWKYLFRKDNNSKSLLSTFLDWNENGDFIGVTFVEDFVHVCFNITQCERIDSLIQQSEKVIEHQKMHYYSGDIEDNEVGMKTFRQAYVQWCPTPIFSKLFNQQISFGELWGLTMEGLVAIRSDVSQYLLDGISGMKLNSTLTMDDSYCLYEIPTLEMAPWAIADNNLIEIDFYQIPQIDIFRVKNGAILISSAFATILKNTWDGMVFVKFQPVICENVDPKLKKFSMRKIKKEKMIQAEITANDFVDIGKYFHCTFPEMYQTWILEHKGRLPMGWLSPFGGIQSELFQYAVQEQINAEPMLPKTLIPIYIFGNGDSVCFSTTNHFFVQWSHEFGLAENIVISTDFNYLLKLLMD